MESKTSILNKLAKKPELEEEKDLLMLTSGISDYEELRALYRTNYFTDILISDSADLMKRIEIFGRNASEFKFDISKYFLESKYDNGNY
jgi:hypothetical protein